MITREQQFAEKTHAYTLPRSVANSRVKDLVDLVESGGLSYPWPSFISHASPNSAAMKQPKQYRP